MEIVSSEATAWMRAAEVAGVELPVDVAQAVESLESVDGQLAALPRPEKVPSPQQLVAAGVELEKAAKEHARLIAKAEAEEEKRRVALGAREIARRALNRAVEAHRDELVLSVRPIVTALVDEARPHAAELAPFHPNFSPGDLMHKATPEQLLAFQDAAALEGKFGALMAAHRASFKVHSRIPGAFDVRDVGAEHRFWAAPEHVANPLLNGTRRTRRGAQAAIQPTILGVAAEPSEAGFRLGTLAELAGVVEAEHRARVQEATDNLGWSKARRMRAL